MNTRPNDYDFAIARRTLAGPRPQNGRFMFGRDFRPLLPEFRTPDIALLRGRTFSDDEVREALRGDGQDLYDQGVTAYDGLWVRFERTAEECQRPELREIWYQSSSWEGAAFAAFRAQVNAAG